MPVEIYWAAEPNDALVPINELAETIHAAFRESRGQRSDIEKRAIKPAWMTESGLVIEGGTPPQRRQLDVSPVLRDLDVTTGAAREDISYVSVLGTNWLVPATLISSLAPLATEIAPVPVCAELTMSLPALTVVAPL